MEVRPPQRGTTRGLGHFIAKVGYDEGWKAGYLRPKANFRLTYPCGVCGKLLAVRAGNPDAKDGIETLVEDEWGHGGCIRK
jgi:hypothetical protein